jgi:hypothetical protein
MLQRSSDPLIIHPFGWLNYKCKTRKTIGIDSGTEYQRNPMAYGRH